MFAETPLNASNKKVQRLFRTLFLLMTGLLILPVLIILTMLVYKGGSALSIDFLFTAPTDGMTAGGIFPALLGTVWLVAVALLISVPIGVAAAIYLSEYAADNWFTRIINLAIINLAGVPSIVHALFGVGAFVIFFGFGTSILAASLTLAIMTLPVVIVATRESLQAVPMAFREACWNMGATRWQTIRRVVLPNAVSGILTGIILEVSRTTGETAPIMFTGAVFFTPFLPQSIFDQTMALSLHLFVVATQVPGVPDDLPYGVALVLIAMVLLMNSVSIAFRMCLRAKKEMVGAATTDSGGSVPGSAVQRTLEVSNLSIRYGSHIALEGVNLDVREHEIFGIIGPANAGKTSFLKALNRMDMFDPAMRVQGDILFQRTRNPPLEKRLRAAFAYRCGVSAAGRVAHDDLRQRRPRPAPARRQRQSRTGCDRRALPDARRALGRGQRPAEFAGQPAVRRPAAAPDHCPRLVAEPGTADAGRVFDRGRPGDHHAHRGRAQGTQTGNDHHPGHQPGAAGASPGRSYRFFPRRSLRRGG